MDTLTPAIDPATGDLSLDDGSLAWSESAPIGLVVWTLRTPLGTCAADPSLGTDWRAARTDTADAPQALAAELERALQWIVAGGWITDLATSAERMAPRGIRYTIAFHDGTRPRTIRGTT